MRWPTDILSTSLGSIFDSWSNGDIFILLRPLLPCQIDDLSVQNPLYNGPKYVISVNLVSRGVTNVSRCCDGIVMYWWFRKDDKWHFVSQRSIFGGRLVQNSVHSRDYPNQTFSSYFRCESNLFRIFGSSFKCLMFLGPGTSLEWSKMPQNRKPGFNISSMMGNQILQNMSIVSYLLNREWSSRSL